MRISSTMMVGNYIKQLNRSAVNQAKLMEQGDGNRIHRASDDPVAYSRMLMFQNSLYENEQYTKNLNDAVSWMKNSDGAMKNMNDILAAIKEKVQKAANGDGGENDMKAVAREVESLVEQLVTLGNSQSGSSYLFSGQMNLTKPFEMVKEKVDKADLKTLDDTQKDLFGTDQMLVMTDGSGTDDGTYYMDPKTGNIYSKKYVDEGYKKTLTDNQGQPQAVQKQAVLNSNLGQIDYNMNDLFTGAGNVGTPIFNKNGEVDPAAGSGAPPVPGSFNTTNGALNGLSFKTSLKSVVVYRGDDQKISVPIQNGEATPKRDSVNVTGVDIFGKDIFGGEGTSVLNDILEIAQRMESGDKEWLQADGMDLADRAVTQVLNAETDLGARTAGYNGSLEVMNAQNAIITEDITNVSGTDVGLLSVELQKAQLIYNMSLSLAAKILPPSLADYL